MRYIATIIGLIVFFSIALHANVDIGWDSYKKGRWVDSILAFRKVLREDPKSLSAHAGLASAMYALARYEEVMTVFPDEIRKGNIDLNEKNQHAFTILKMIGFSSFKNKQSKKAIVALSVAIKIQDDDPSIYNTLGLAYLNTGSPRLSEIAFRTAVNLDARNPIYINNLGASYIDQKLYREALLCFEKAVRLDSNYQNGWENVWMGRDRLGLPSMRGHFNYSYFLTATEEEKKQKNALTVHNEKNWNKKNETIQKRKMNEDEAKRKTEEMKKKQEAENRSSKDTFRKTEETKNNKVSVLTNKNISQTSNIQPQVVSKGSTNK